MTTYWTPADIDDQTGRVVLVTGANAGLGLALAKDFAYRGARVLMACRNLAKAEAAAASIRSGLPMANLDIVELDLASLASVSTAAEAVRSSEGHLDLLINNAGLMALDESRTEEGFEMQFGVNHLGHFALTADLLDLLVQTPGSRIVTMSSQGHRAGRIDFDDPNFRHRPYRRWPAYFQSKLANILFTAELDRRLRANQAATAALAAHPGGTRTDLGTEGHGLSNRLFNMTMIGQSPEAGALPTLRAATDAAAVGGQYYGPRWAMSGRAVLTTPSKRARNADDAARLWNLSEELTARPGVLSLP